jgi:hypothetical protein
MKFTLHKFCIGPLVLFIQIVSVYSQTLLQPGDIAIVGYNFKDPDQFSFVALNEIPQGTVLYFTDAGYDTTLKQFRVGEGYLIYTVPAGGLTFGQVITYPDEGVFTKVGVSGFFGFNAAGDQITVFQSSYTSPYFIYSLHAYNNQWQETVTNNNTTGIPPGLEDGRTAIHHGGNRNGKFTCNILDWNKESYLQALASEELWVFSTDRVSIPDVRCKEIPLQWSAALNVSDSIWNKMDTCILQVVVTDLLGRPILTAKDLDEVWSKKYLFREKYCIFNVYYATEVRRSKYYIVD